MERFPDCGGLFRRGKKISEQRRVCTGSRIVLGFSAPLVVASGLEVGVLVIRPLEGAIFLLALPMLVLRASPVRRVLLRLLLRGTTTLHPAPRLAQQRLLHLPQLVSDDVCAGYAADLGRHRLSQQH